MSRAGTESPERNDPPPPRIAIFGDFVCPWSYLAADYPERIHADYGFAVQWRPHWLHPEVPPEGAPLPADRSRREAVHQWLTELAPDKAARMRFPDKLQCSFRAFEALQLADHEGCGARYAAAVFDELWCAGNDIGEIRTLQHAGERVGLDAEALGSALRSHRFLERALAAVQQARTIGVSATPTMFIGRARIDGWHYYDVVEQVFERLGYHPIVGTGPASATSA